MDFLKPLGDAKQKPEMQKLKIGLKVISLSIASGHSKGDGKVASGTFPTLFN